MNQAGVTKHPRGHRKASQGFQKLPLPFPFVKTEGVPMDQELDTTSDASRAPAAFAWVAAGCQGPGEHTASASKMSVQPPTPPACRGPKNQVPWAANGISFHLWPRLWLLEASKANRGCLPSAFSLGAHHGPPASCRCIPARAHPDVSLPQCSDE